MTPTEAMKYAASKGFPKGDYAIYCPVEDCRSKFWCYAYDFADPKKKMRRHIQRSHKDYTLKASKGGRPVLASTKETPPALQPSKTIGRPRGSQNKEKKEPVILFDEPDLGLTVGGPEPPQCGLRFPSETRAANYHKKRAKKVI